MSDSDQAPEQPVTPTANTERQASRKLWLLAISFSLIFIAVNVYFTTRYRTDAVSIAAAVIACLIWPLMAVGIASIWKKNRNSYIRVKTFLITTIFFLVMGILAHTVIPKYQDYVKQLKLEQQQQMNTEKTEAGEHVVVKTIYKTEINIPYPETLVPACEDYMALWEQIQNTIPQYLVTCFYDKKSVADLNTGHPDQIMGLVTIVREAIRHEFEADAFSGYAEGLKQGLYVGKEEQARSGDAIVLNQWTAFDVLAETESTITSYEQVDTVLGDELQQTMMIYRASVLVKKKIIDLKLVTAATSGMSKEELIRQGDKWLQSFIDANQ